MVTFRADWKHHFKVKTAMANFGENLGYFLFSHLVFSYITLLLQFDAE